MRMKNWSELEIGLCQEVCFLTLFDDKGLPFSNCETFVKFFSLLETFLTLLSVGLVIEDMIFNIPRYVSYRVNRYRYWP